MPCHNMLQLCSVAVAIFLVCIGNLALSQELCRSKTQLDGTSQYPLDCVDFRVNCSGTGATVSWNPSRSAFCYGIDWGYDCYETSSKKRLETNRAFGEFYSTSGGPIRIGNLPVSSEIHCVFFACGEQDYVYYPLPSSATVTCSGQVSPTTTLYPGSGDDLDTIPTSTTLVQQTVMPASSEHHQTISPVTTSLYDQENTLSTIVTSTSTYTAIPRATKIPSPTPSVSEHVPVPDRVYSASFNKPDIITQQPSMSFSL